MKQVLLVLLSLFIVWIVWTKIISLLTGFLLMAFNLALIALFCYALYRVYKALSREKIM